MRSIEHTPSVSPPFQKIEDAVRTTGLSSFFLAEGLPGWKHPLRSLRADILHQCARVAGAVRNRRGCRWEVSRA